MTELAIDTKHKRIRVRLELIGEHEPVEIEITRYHLVHNDHGPEITIQGATASRPWLEVALREFVIGQTFPIPRQAAALLKLIA